jgi:hypothetical protein
MSYLGPTLCCRCRGVIRPAAPGHEQDPVSHGIGRCCWAAYRAELGLPARPTPAQVNQFLFGVKP